MSVFLVYTKLETVSLKELNFLLAAGLDCLQAEKARLVRCAAERAQHRQWPAGAEGIVDFRQSIGHKAAHAIAAVRRRDDGLHADVSLVRQNYSKAGY